MASKELGQHPDFEAETFFLFYSSSKCIFECCLLRMCPVKLVFLAEVWLAFICHEVKGSRAVPEIFELFECCCCNAFSNILHKVWNYEFHRFKVKVTSLLILLNAKVGGGELHARTFPAGLVSRLLPFLRDTV